MPNTLDEILDNLIYELHAIDITCNFSGETHVER